MDLPAAEAAARALLEALGEDPGNKLPAQTPRRFVRALTQMLAGRRIDPAMCLQVRTEPVSDELLMHRNLRLVTLCEQSLMPIVGRVHVAYLPRDGRVVRLGSLVRALDALMCRPQALQRLGNQIADLLAQALEPRGVGVVIEAERIAATEADHATRLTFAWQGEMETAPALRDQVLQMTTHDGTA